MLQKVQNVQRVRDQVPPGKPIRLGTLRLVRREMGRVYRDARSARIPTQEATRLTYMLVALARTMEMEMEMEVKQKIAASANSPGASGSLAEFDGLLARFCAKAKQEPQSA